MSALPATPPPTLADPRTERATAWSPNPPMPPIVVPSDRTPVGPQHRVVVGNVNPGTWSTPFARAVMRLQMSDVRGHFAGVIDRRSGANISKPRNEVVKAYLDDGFAEEAHWLLWLDSDMVPREDLLVRLLAAADAAQARVVGALTVMDLGETGWTPNLFQFAPDGAGYTRVQFDYPDGAVVQVAATGAACLMVHRDVLREMREHFASDYAWFGETVVRTGSGEHWLGEDVTFCTRAVEGIGERVFIDCNAWVGHARGSTVHWPPDARRFDPNAPVAVVVPMKDRAELTAQLLDEIRRDTPVGVKVHTWVVDNGSQQDDTRMWLDVVAEASDVTLLRMPDSGIHEMWNAGARAAVADLGSRCRVVFLNNDVALAPGALGVLSRAMADHPDFALMSFNYDGRSADTEVVEVQDICANRYDGTGGLAGFAFAARGEMFTGGYAFPTECRWWFGDNDIVDAALFADHMAAAGKGFGRYRIGIAVNARCTHLDGGGKTAGDWSSPQWQEITAADQVGFARRHAARWAGPLLDTALAQGHYRAAVGILADLAGTEHVPAVLAVVDELTLKVTGKADWSAVPDGPVGRVLVLGVGSGVEVLPWLDRWGVETVDPAPLPGWLRAAGVTGHRRPITEPTEWPAPFDVVVVAHVDVDRLAWPYDELDAHRSAFGPRTVILPLDTLTPTRWEGGDDAR
jgi:GT2 family glycosyltransferase